MAAKVANKPSPHLEGKYRVIGLVPGPVKTYRHGEVDLRSISLELAEKLHAEGFPYLKKIVKKSNVKSS